MIDIKQLKEALKALEVIEKYIEQEERKKVKKSPSCGIELMREFARREVLHTDIGELNLNVRAYNRLRISGIRTIGDLIKLTPNQIRKFRGMGEQSINIVNKALEEYGIDNIKF